MYNLFKLFTWVFVSFSSVFFLLRVYNFFIDSNLKNKTGNQTTIVIKFAPETNCAKYANFHFISKLFSNGSKSFPKIFIAIETAINNMEKHNLISKMFILPTLL